MKLKDLFEDSVNSDNQTNSQFFKTYEDTKNWLDNMGIKKYKINKDTLIVDIAGNVDLSNKEFDYIPVKFGKVIGWFKVDDVQNLKSLIGCPNSMRTIFCDLTGIKNFNGLGSIKNISAYDIKSLESFEGLPNKLESLDIGSSCHKVNSLDHFPKIIENTLFIGPDFKWADSLYKHMEMCGVIGLVNDIGKYSNILKLLYVKGVYSISSSSTDSDPVTNILNAEIKRQPDPRKRNLLKVAQELSNAGFHHLTV